MPLGEHRPIVSKTGLAALLLGSLVAVPISTSFSSLPNLPTITPATNGAGTPPAFQGQFSLTPNFRVNLGTGNVHFSFVTSRFFYQGLSPRHELSLHFNSLAVEKPGDFTGGLGLGQGWSTSVGSRLEFPTTSKTLLTQADGSEVVFEKQTDGSWEAIEGFFSELLSVSNGWTVRTKAQWVYRYDSSGRLLEINDASGNAYSITYEGNRVSRAVEPSGRFVDFFYSGEGRLDSVVDSFGSIWSFSFDSNGRLQEIADPVFGPISILYDSAGRLQSYEDLDGGTWQFSYWTSAPWKDQVKTITDPDRHVYQFGYSETLFNRTTQVTDPRSGLWHTVHLRNELPSLLRHENPLGQRWTYVHDDNRLLTKWTSPRNHSWTRAYDERGNLLELKDPLGRLSEFTYDSLNNLTAILENGTSFALFYEDPQHPTKITRTVSPPDDSGACATTTYEYFGPDDGSSPGEWNGRLARVVDGLGSETRFAYDNLGMLTEVEEGPDGASGTLRAQYAGDDVTFADLGGMTYPSHFPSLPSNPSALQGRLEQTASGAGEATWRSEPKVQDFFVTVPIDSGNGWEHSRVTRRSEYDNRGRLIGLEVESDEPLLQVASPPPGPLFRSFTTNFEDAHPFGRVEVATPDGGLLTYLRDGADRISHVLSNDGGAGEISTQINYFDDGLVRSRIRNDGTSSHYEYTANSLVERIEHFSGTTLVLGIEYEYDDRNVPLTITENSLTDTVIKTYSYDPRLRLTAESRSVASSGEIEQRVYEYDQAGNRTLQRFLRNGSLVESTVYHYDLEEPGTYQSHHNRLTWIEHFSDTGELLSTTWLFYDNPFGNVSRIVRREAGSTSYSAIALVYTEKGLPWLLWDETWDDFGGGPTNVTRDVVLETRRTGFQSRLWRRRDGTTLAPLAGAEWTNVYGLMTASYSVDPADGTATGFDLTLSGLGRLHNGNLVSEVYDKLNSMRLSTSTQEDYDAFGVRISGGAPVADSGFAGGLGARQGFQGSPLSDGELVKMGYRYYSPLLGRFIMRDPIGIADGPNVYSFVRNVPTARVDPEGLAAHGGQYRGSSSGPKPSLPPFRRPNWPDPPVAPPGPSEPGDPGFVGPPAPPEPSDNNFVGPLVPQPGDPGFVGPPAPPEI